MTPKAVLDLAKKNEVKIVDIKFMDLLGTWQHFSVPTSELEESLFEDGLGFDGSSIRGWQAINNSDMLVMPDPTTAMMDPFMNDSTLSLLCNIVDPLQRSCTQRILVMLLKRRKPISSRPELVTRHILDRKRSFSSLMM